MGEKVYFDTAAAARYRRITCQIRYPDISPIGIVVILHSAGEHSGLYSEFSKKLADAGFAVVSHDWAGHGKSAGEKFELGFISDSMGYHCLIEDTKKVVNTAYKKVSERCGKNIPVVLLGQGVGASIAKALASEIWCKAIVLCGDLGEGNLPKIKIWLCDQVAQIKGDRSRSVLFTRLATGPLYKEKGFKFYDEGLTGDEKSLSSYRNDPLCGFSLTLSAVADVLSLRIHAEKKETYENIPSNVAALILSGDKDIFTKNGKVAEEIEERFLKTGHHLVKRKVYSDMRHQLLREINSDEVFCDIIEFLKTIK